MKKLLKNFDFWHWFGILAAFMICIWISIQVFNHLTRKTDYQLIAQGEFFDFHVPPFTNYNQDKYENNYEVQILEEMLPSELENNNELAKDIFFYTSNKYPENHTKFLQSFKSLWRFSIKNTGSKTVKNLYLEVPFNGKCLITWRNEKSNFFDFNNKIQIDELVPSDEVNILIWSSRNIPNYANYSPQNTRVVYPHGSVDINYPIRAAEIIVWNAKHDNYPLIFSFAGLLILIFVIITISYHIGLNSNKKRQEIELLHN